VRFVVGSVVVAAGILLVLLARAWWSGPGVPGDAGEGGGFAFGVGATSAERSDHDSSRPAGVDFGQVGLTGGQPQEVVAGVYPPYVYGIQHVFHEDAAVDTMSDQVAGHFCWSGLDQRLRRNLSLQLVDLAKLEATQGRLEHARSAAAEALSIALEYSTPADPVVTGAPTPPPPPGTDSADHGPGEFKAPRNTDPSDWGAHRGGQQVGRDPGKAPPRSPEEPPRVTPQLSAMVTDPDPRPLDVRLAAAMAQGWFGPSAYCYLCLSPVGQDRHADPAEATFESPNTPSTAPGVRWLLVARRRLERGDAAGASQAAFEATTRLFDATESLLSEARESPDDPFIVSGNHYLGADPFVPRFAWGWLSPDFVLTALSGHLEEAAERAGLDGPDAKRIRELVAAVNAHVEEGRRPGSARLPHWTTDRALARVPT